MAGETTTATTQTVTVVLAGQVSGSTKGRNGQKGK